MSELQRKLEVVNLAEYQRKKEIIDQIKQLADGGGYRIEEIDDTRPWGGFIKLNNQDANKFIADFFDDFDPDAVRLGNPEAELSPKFLLVGPEQRLSWQYHNRRAEIWKFITSGGYYRSLDDNQGGLFQASPGEIVQFGARERHRLVGVMGSYSLVAEIWQHIDPNYPSDEDDITRLQDDYKRAA